MPPGDQIDHWSKMLDVFLSNLPAIIVAVGGFIVVLRSNKKTDKRVDAVERTTSDTNEVVHAVHKLTNGNLTEVLDSKAIMARASATQLRLIFELRKGIGDMDAADEADKVAVLAEATAAKHKKAYYGEPGLEGGKASKGLE